MTQPIRIAVCLYGQIRAEQVCRPWLDVQYGFETLKLKENPLDHTRPSIIREDKVEIDYFIATKDYDTRYRTFDSREKIQRSSQDINSYIDHYHPVKYDVATYEQELSYNLPTDNYGMAIFYIVAKSVLLKQQYELKTGIKYDVCVVQRPEILLGPRPEAFKQHLEQVGISPNTVFVEKTKFFFESDGWLDARQDLFFFGSNFAVDQLISRFSMLWEHAPHKRRDLGLNTHTQLPNLAYISNTKLESTDVAAAIVRENADHNRSILDSFDYHSEFWLAHHLSVLREISKE